MGRGCVLSLVLVCALLWLPSGSQQRSLDGKVQGLSYGGLDDELELFGFGARGESQGVAYGGGDRWRPEEGGDFAVDVAVEPSGPDDPPAADEPPPPSPPPPSPSPPPPSTSPPPPSKSPPPPSKSPPPPSPSPPPPSPSPPPPSPSPPPPSPSPPPPSPSPPPPSPSPPPPSPSPPPPSPPPPSPPPPSPPPPPPALATLSSLQVSNGAILFPPFLPDVSVYHTTVGERVSEVRITASVPFDIKDYELKLDSLTLISGVASPPVSIGANGETVNFVITVAAPGYSKNTYCLSLYRSEKSRIWWKILKWALMVMLGLLLIVAIIFCCFYLYPLGRRWWPFGRPQSAYESVNPDPSPLVNTEDRGSV